MPQCLKITQNVAFEFFKHCAQGRSWKLKRSFICHAWAYFMASRKTPPKTTSPTLQNAKANFPYSRNCNFWQMIRICRWSAKVNVVTPWRVSAYSNFGIKGLTSLESKMAWHISERSTFLLGRNEWITIFLRWHKIGMQFWKCSALSAHNSIYSHHHSLLKIKALKAVRRTGRQGIWPHFFHSMISISNI